MMWTVTRVNCCSAPLIRNLTGFEASGQKDKKKKRQMKEDRGAESEPRPRASHSNNILHKTVRSDE